MSDSQRNLGLVMRELLARRATGVLAVTTNDMTGEVRLRAGAVEDVVFGRAEGAKALARMFAATEPRFAFRETAEGWLRRIEEASDDFVARAVQAAAAIRTSTAPFESRREAHVIGVELGESTGALLGAAARALWAKLRAPTRFHDVFDLAPDDDAAIATLLAELESVGAIRWLDLISERQPLGIGGHDVSRLRDRFGERVRIAVAGTVHRLAVFTHALLHVDDVVRPAREAPAVPMPHVIATLPLEGVAIDVVACPLVPAYSPVWPIALADVLIVVRLDEAAPHALEAVAAMIDTRVAQAEALVGKLDEGQVGAVAALVRASLDHALDAT